MANVLGVVEPQYKNKLQIVKQMNPKQCASQRIKVTNNHVFSNT